VDIVVLFFNIPGRRFSVNTGDNGSSKYKSMTSLDTQY